MAVYTIDSALLATPTIGERLAQSTGNVLAGRFLYIDGAGNLAYAVPTGEDKATVVGISLTSTAGPGQVVHYQTAGVVDVGAAIFGAAGKRLVLHGIGKAKDEADLATGNRVTYLGVTVSDHEFNLDIMVTGQQAP